VIVSDITHTDTTATANILLPALGWGEKDGTVTNSERCISRQRAFKDAPGNAKADWWIVNQVAQKLGFADAFNYTSAHEIFSEHARLSGFENNGSRDFDISALERLSASDYDQLNPVQWPVTSSSPNGTARMFEQGRFYTPNAKANFVSNRACLAQSSSSPYLLNTGRVRDQWHTMSRTGLAPSLSGHSDVPFVQINPADATQLNLKNGRFARLSAEFGEFIARVETSVGVKQGQLFSPIHWNSMFANSANVGDIVSAEVDPVSGQPELKASTVLIEPFNCLQWARIASKTPLERDAFSYWAQTKTSRGYISLVGVDHEFCWQSLIPVTTKSMEYTAASSTNLLAMNETGELDMMIFAGTQVEKIPSFYWLSSAFDRDDASQVASLLRAESGARDRLVCSCFNVSEKAIKADIERGAETVEALGERLGCGAKCGSCKPELAAIIA